MKFMDKIKDRAANAKDDAREAAIDFREHCIDQWYLFLEESMYDVLKSLGFAIAWLVFNSYLYTGGFIMGLIFIGLAAGAVLYIIQPVLNIFILALRCFGAKFKYI